MLGEETTIPEEVEDVFERVGIDKADLLIEIQEMFLDATAHLYYALELRFQKAEVTRHNNEETFHFVYEAGVYKDPQAVRSMLEKVGAELAEILNYQTALSVILPGE